MTENKYEGSFTYLGSGIDAGDTVAIYSGIRPDMRTKDTVGTSADGEVVYVKITAKSGNLYSYRTADVEDVLFIPDILPLPSDADEDGEADNNSIKVELAVMDFSGDLYEEMGLDSQTTVDVGDYIAFYTGNLKTGTKAAGYARITQVSEDGEYYVIAYVPVEEDEMMASMDLYMTRNEEIGLTEEEKEKLESDLEKQAVESGFVEEAALYLTALALETDGFRELAGDLDMSLASYSITFADGTPVSRGGIKLTGKESRAKITKREIDATVAYGKVLQHFDGKYGVRAELAIIFTVEVDEKIEINVQAVFEQEVLITVNASGGAVWK